MELFISLVILVPIFITLVASSRYPQQFDQDDDRIFYEESPEDTADTSIKFLGVNHPSRNRLREEADNDMMKYKYELNQPPQYIDWEALDLPMKEKKQGHSETLCMSIPTKRKILEQNIYDFKPNTLIEYSCESLPSGGIHNPLLIPDNAQICKVQGACQTRHREIRIFKKKKNAITGEAHCWEKINYNSSVGCQCLVHILQQPLV